MNLDKHTFGKTPAAIYLADRLNFLNDPKYTRKVSSKIHDIQAIIADAIRAHEGGLLSIRTLNFILTSLRSRIEDMTHAAHINALEGDLYADKLVTNLMANVLIGELKSILRRTRDVKILKTKQQRIINRAIVNSKALKELNVKPITIADVKDPTTAETLIARSRAKLQRKGLPNTLYED
jgi:hypothetical protein